MPVYGAFVATGAFYAALSVWRLSIGSGRRRETALVGAFFGMALWALCQLSVSADVRIMGELARNLGWLGYLATATHNAPEQARPVWRKWEAALALVAILSVFLNFIGRGVPFDTISGVSLLLAALVLQLVFLIGGIIFLHNLNSDIRSAGTAGARLIVISLAVLWAYDLNAFTISLLGSEAALWFVAFRPFVSLALMPFFAVAARRRDHWKVVLSRKATFQSLSLVAIGVYFVGISVATRAIAGLGGAAGLVFGVFAVVALSAVGLVVLFVPGARAWLRVIVTKHLFSHRYDYRTEWLRFSATIADAKGSDLTLEERAVKAVADVTESPAGLLMLATADDTFEIVSAWRWDVGTDGGNDTGGIVRIGDAVLPMLQSGLIVRLTPDSLQPEQNAGLIGAREAWVGVPLISLSGMVGIVVLAKPDIARELDWEDFDLLKVIGQQVAGHLSDAHKQAQLEEVRRFEEFNRRFAYIIHDIKNVVSQLSLMASNAEQHGSNVKFQAEMNRSLVSAVEKMRVLLGRLSPDRVFNAPAVMPVDLDTLLTAVAAGYSGTVTTEAARGVRAIGVADRLKLAIEHLVQNAIEASPPGTPVTLAARADGERCLVSVTDRGAGMSADFIRRGLFKPFVSTKGGGFGIGAAEAKSLVTAMGGKLRVSSVEGRGSVFTIDLPLDVAQG